MEPDASVESAATIRVVVLQVGEVSSSVFRQYSSLVMSQRRIDLNNALSFYKADQKSPFPLQPWDTGYLRFKFIVGSAARNQWEDFQAQRKVHGVIGIVHCPQSPDIGEAYEEFIQACRAYPSAQAKRCFAFDPSEAQVEQDDKRRKHLILFPWGDPQKLVGDMMLDFAATMLMAFESWVVHPVGAILTTPLDSQTSLSTEEGKKRRLGRIQKSIGDYCLLAGSPRDAHEHYSSALDLARLSNDVFWQAGALEGITTAIVVDTGEKTEMLETTVRENYKEVLQLYRRSSAPLFELEAALKLARYLCRKELARHVVELLSGAVETGRLLANSNDRLVLYMEVAKIFAKLGYERKAAFFARQVAQLYQTQDSRYAAISTLQILNLTAPLYKVQSQGSIYSTSPALPVEGLSEQYKPTSRSLQQASREKGEGQWTNLQMDLLGDIVAMAMRAGEPLVAWAAAARLLRSHYPLITPAGQAALAAALSASAGRLPRGTRCYDPALPFIRLHSFPSNPAAAQIVKRTPGKEDWWNGPAGMGPFIYTPFSTRGSQEKEKRETLWVAGEVVQAMVELANPCSFEVEVESISLSVTGNFEAFPVSISLPPNTSSQLLPLAGVPRSEGPATIRGCFVRCFGVLVEHCFENVWEVSSAARGTVLADPFRGADLKRSLTPSTEVVVVPPLPLLVAVVGGGEGAPVLFEGEEREIQLKLTNAGAVSVCSANMALLGRQKEQVAYLDAPALQRALPLLPGASVSVTIRLLAQFLSNEKSEAGNKKGGGNHSAVPGTKEDTSVMIVIHYAGPEDSPTGDDEGGEVGKARKTRSNVLPPGRRLTVPVQLHAQRGLYLVKARLLAMGGTAGAGGRGLAKTEGTITVKTPRGTAGGKKDLELADVPVREAKGLRLLELELWNGTDVGFEVSTSVVTGLDRVSGKGGTVEHNQSKHELTKGHRRTRVDRECSARVLIPLEPFQENRNTDNAMPAESLGEPLKAKKQFVLPQNAAEARAAAEYEAAVEAICSRIRVQWHSGRNSHGVLQIRRAVLEALKGPALDILLPDLVSFSFRLRPLGSSTKVRESASKGPRQNEDSEAVVARELTLVELTVHNSSEQTMVMSLSITCRDVTGANCMGGTGVKATAFWAGVMNGAEVDVPPWGEAVHQFSLCFLIPGEYTLLAAAIVELRAQSASGLPANDETGLQRICCSGLPHQVVVVANVNTADMSSPLYE